MLCSARLDGSYAIRMLLHSRGFLHNSRDGARERRRGGRRGKRGGEGGKKWMDLVLPFFLRGRDLQPRGRRWPRRYFRKFFNNNSRVDESLSLSAYFIDECHEGATSALFRSFRFLRYVMAFDDRNTFLSRVTFFFYYYGEQLFHRLEYRLPRLYD